MFGDNKHVVDSAIHPYPKLHKHHTDLSFHRVQETIEFNMVDFCHEYGVYNTDDILSNYWRYTKI